MKNRQLGEPKENDLIGRQEWARNNLPPGHVLIKETQQRVQAEYAACQAIERRYAFYIWKKQSLKHLMFITDPDVLRQLLFQICDDLGNERPRIYWNSDRIKPGVFACASNKSLYFRNFANIVVGCHELTHFFGERGHGPSFCEMEEFVLEHMCTLIGVKVH